ncbi:MAG: NAD(P)-dependent oxidoreductase, partial [Actinomycetota bacterium]
MVSSPTKIGFVGLGNMGLPMCKRLVAAKYLVKAFDLKPENIRQAEKFGAVAARSAVDCGSDVDVFLTSLPRPEHVRAVMIDSGALAKLGANSIWVDLTTNQKELLVELANNAPPSVKVLDSPVTGAVDGARNGRLTLFVGGDAETVAKVRPMLENLGKVIHCGALGTGNVVKLVTNQLWFVAAAAIGEGFATGISNGVELGTLWQAIKESVGDSFVARHDAPSIFAGHYDPSFSVDMFHKDIGMFGDQAEIFEAQIQPIRRVVVAGKTRRCVVARDETVADALFDRLPKRA